MNGGIWDGDADGDGDGNGDVEYEAEYEDSVAVTKTVKVNVKKRSCGLHVAQAVANAWNTAGFPPAVAYCDGTDEKGNPSGRLSIAANILRAKCDKKPLGLEFTSPKSATD